MNDAIGSFLRGILKTTLVHRHAFIPSLTQTREIGCEAGLPASADEAVESLSVRPMADVEACFGRGQWTLAAARLDRLISRRPVQPGPKILRGLLGLFAPGDLAAKGDALEGMLERYANGAGVSILEKAVAQYPEFWPGCFWLALADLRRCEFVKAKAACDGLVRLRPDWAWSYILRSEWGRVGIEFDDALRDLGRAAALEPRNAWVYALRSRVRFQKAPEAAAIGDLDRAIELDGRSGWMRAWRGDARRKLADVKGALGDLLRAKALEPAYDRTYLWLGKVLQSLGLDERALDALDEGFQRCAYFEKAYSQRARLLCILGRHAEALRDMNNAVRINHRHNWLGSWTVQHYPLGAEQRRVLCALEDFVAASPRSGWALAWRGESRVQTGDLSGGLCDIDRGLRLRPNLAWAWAWRGEALVRLGRFSEAGASLEKALKFDPSYGRAYAWRGRLRQLQGRHEASVRDFEKSVGDALIEYSWLYFWKAEAEAALGRTSEALSDARTAASLEPGRAEFHDFARSLETSSRPRLQALTR